MKVTSLLLLLVQFLASIGRVNGFLPFEIDFIACPVFGIFANFFNDNIAGILNSTIGGTSMTIDVPPYDEFQILGVDTPFFDGCEINLRVLFVFRQMIGVLPDSYGYADVNGFWDPNVLFDVPWNIQVCFNDLVVTQVETSNEPEVVEDFAEDMINDELDNPECVLLFGEAESEAPSLAPSQAMDVGFPTNMIVDSSTLSMTPTAVDNTDVVLSLP